MRSIFSLGAAALLLTSCASIVQGSSDKVNIITGDNQNAACQVQNGRGSWSVAAPGATEVKRSKTDLSVSCTNRQGVTGSKQVEPSLEGWLLGNIVFGGLIGLGIDFGTGSAWHYPQDVVVPMQSGQASALPPAIEPVSTLPPASQALPAPQAVPAMQAAPAAVAPMQPGMQQQRPIPLIRPTRSN